MREITDRDRILRTRRDMIYRCYNPKNKWYKHYGGRGITVCDEWLNDKEAFYKWAIENGYKQGLEIDRKDNNSEYSPQNCHWVTRAQNTNNREITLFITYKGETKPLAEVAEENHINPRVLYNRIFLNGWDVDKAVETPSLFKRKRKLITYNGETHDIYEWSKITGIKAGTIQGRLREGKPLEEVFDNRQWNFSSAEKSKGGIQVEYKGKTQSLRAWSRELNLDYKKTRDKYKQGFPLDEVFKSEEKENIIYDITYKGQIYSAKQFAKSINASYMKVLKLIREGITSGEEIFNIINKPVPNTSPFQVLYTINNETKTLEEWCLDYDISPKTVLRKLKRGLPIEKALIKEVAKKYSSKFSEKFEYKGNSYTMKELSELSGIEEATIRHRIKKIGMSVEEALTDKQLNVTYYEINGVSKTLREWCEETGMLLSTAKGRIDKGIPVELAIDPTLNSSNGRALLDAVKQYEKDHPEYKRDHKTGSAFLITYNGETKLASEWAKEKGMDTYIVRNRYKNGYPAELCVNPNLQSKDGRALLDAYNEYLKDHPDYDKEKEKELRSHK